ncbi:C-type lectin-like, partial [Trinorchestia longiramus]
YDLVAQKVIYEDAVQLCSDKGGKLAIPTSEANNEFIRGLISTKTWIGAPKWNPELLLGSSGQKIPYHNFDLLEGLIGWPNEDCIYMNLWGRWKDTSCRDRYPVLCETAVTVLCNDDDR